MINRFIPLSSQFLYSNPSRRVVRRFCRKFCTLNSAHLQKKLREQKLTKHEVRQLITERETLETRLSELEKKLSSGALSSIQNQLNKVSSQHPGLVPAGLGSRGSGSSRTAPLFIERVGEKKWQSFFTTIVFWVILLSVWVHFQRGQNSVQNMFDDNYTEYDEIHWEDDEDGEQAQNETPPEEKPQTWRDKILALFGISIDTDDANKKESRRRKQKRVTFNDVCGCEEAKEDLTDIVYYLKHPEDFRQLGIKLPRGVLLEGPPGTGKTLMARALAGEAGVPFLSTNGSGFDQIFVGVGVMRVKNLFERAKELAPCIIFIDEIDAIGSSRNSVSVSPHASDSLNALLVELDGFEPNNGVIVLAATNMAQKLDKALVRAGRFDRTIRVGLPDRKQRTAIVTMYLKDNADDTVDVETLISDLAGFSGADLANVVNLAGIEAVKDKRDKISMKDLVEAKETVAMGRARKSMVVPRKEKELTAYHEGGHAIVALFTKGANPIYKATLMPRGPALGMVTFTSRDEYSRTREELLAQLDVGMGGRAAEELIFGADQITTGASSDFNQVTNIATRMVTQFGMSEAVGKVFYEPRDIEKLSPELQNLINSEIKRLLDDAYARATNTLIQHSDDLETLARTLLEQETLTIDQIQELLQYNEDQAESPYSEEAEAPNRPSLIPRKRVEDSTFKKSAKSQPVGKGGYSMQ